MQLNEEQYERIAQWLDGRDINLSDIEREAAEEIRRDEKLMGDIMTVDAPAEAFVRAQQRMSAELAKPVIRIIPLRRIAAAAAIILIAAGVWLVSQPGDTTLSGYSSKAPISAIIDEMLEVTDDDTIALVTDEVAQLRTELVVSPDYTMMDLEINAIEDEIKDVFLEDVPGWELEEGLWSS